MNKYYQETKQKIDAIREKYTSTGDVIFRAAIQLMINIGADNFRDEDRFNQILILNEPESIIPCAERMTLNCARALSEIPTLSLLAYLQREIYFGSDGISYKRAIELLKRTIDELIEELAEYAHEGCTLYDLHEAGFKDAEIEELGFGYLFDMEDEE